MTSVRDEIVEYLRSHVVGPREGAEEHLNERPFKRYLMGTLYPANAATGSVLSEEVENATNGGVGEELVDDPVTLANSWLPSSLGISFFINGQPSIECGVWGARYAVDTAGKREAYTRVPIAEPASPEPVRLEWDGVASSTKSKEPGVVLEGRAMLDAVWRTVNDGFLVTVTLRNNQRQKDGGVDGQVDAGLCLHQIGFSCEPTSGVIREYPSVQFLSRDEEEAELRLLHRHARVFGIGHGCAADWVRDGRSDHARSVRTELLPRFEVSPVVTAGIESAILELERLANTAVSSAQLVAELSSFASDYERWVDGLAALNTDIPLALIGARDRLLERVRAVLGGIRRGIATLGSDADVLRAFRLANRAMLMQMRHNKSDLAGTRRERDQPSLEGVLYTDLGYRWRPFQLAFLLLTLPSVTRAESDERDIVDLLWFPTGGGKTEAYLTVAALEIFLRRIRSGDAGAGTAVITRYTLRLLTAQQFQRAATLICAAEILRREHAADMGKTPISIGLWVGNTVTPGKYVDAVARFEQALEAPSPQNPFQLEQCPWCGTSIFPAKADDEREAYGVRATNSSFEFFCPSRACPFHLGLPVGVVDQALYENPPTFLLGTVDKFARLAWEEGGGAFFGGNGCEPPSLIIQDEMHLLSGPLGTTVGVYEGAIEALIAYHGARPKIIASTATIRRAPEQTLGLFGRRVRLFPPPGLSADDSYFARVDDNQPGRLYVGLMSQSHTPHTTIVHSAAALLQAPAEFKLQHGDKDAYWTLVAYHNSLRELGRTVTLARDDIPARIKVIATDHSHSRELTDESVVELTSNVGGFELPSMLERLKHGVEQGDAVSVLATTNMLSVGVDIPRLGLMLVNGQPKTTSEYIQATSRVGRGSVPGLVVALYVSTKPRDRSHYEAFVPYHSALYRQVEPTSVTPYSLPSRQRALHAAFVILMRHGGGLAANDSAGQFSATLPAVEHAKNVLRERVRAIDPREYEPASRQLDEIIARWDMLARDVATTGKKLYYQAHAPHTGLLKSFGEDGEGWQTLHSMRSVDRQCGVVVIGEGGR